MTLGNSNSYEPIRRVAVLGANGQVGSELCLLLDIMGQVKPIAVARSEYGTSLLRTLGIECRHPAGGGVREVAGAISDCDAVVDLSLPSQENSALMRREIAARAATICKAMKRRTPLIYCSTMAVYHLTRDQPAYTTYGKMKLFAERKCEQAGRRTGHDVFVLRLGQVHGALQGSSIGLVRELRQSQKVLVPDTRSLSVFVTSIAEAVCRIIQGDVRPARYSLFSDPAWSYEELVLWQARQIGLEIEVRKVPPENRAWLPLLENSTVKLARNLLYRHRERLSDYAWAVSPNLAARMKFRYHCRLAAANIAAYRNNGFARVFIEEGPVGGTRFPGLTDSRITMPPLHAKLHAQLQLLT